MNGPVRRHLLPILLALLAACSAEKPADPLAERDTVVAEALDDPIMADPDLASRNGGDTVLTGGGPITVQVPPDKSSVEEADRARSAARDLLGGTIPAAPDPERGASESPLARAATMEAVATALKLTAPQCPAKLAYGFIWAAKVSAAVPVYPRGHARVAAGTDSDGCKLRVVRFATPASVQDLADFYHASAMKAGLAPQHRQEGTDRMVSGGKGPARFAVYIRAGADGITEADLATSGF